MRRTLAAVAISASLVTAPPNLFDRLWAFLSAFWDAPMSLSADSPQTKEGCGADPSGLCKPAPPPQTDEGCGADPDGLCNPES